MENKQQTPLQRLIAIIKNKGFKLAKENRDIECWILAEIQVEAEELLPYEREVIEKAYDKGYDDGFNEGLGRIYKYGSAKEYFNQTFQTNE